MNTNSSLSATTPKKIFLQLNNSEVCLQQFLFLFERFSTDFSCHISQKNLLEDKMFDKNFFMAACEHLARVFIKTHALMLASVERAMNKQNCENDIIIE